MTGGTPEHHRPHPPELATPRPNADAFAATGPVLAAQAVAGRLLAEALPRRWAHSQGVARQAQTLAGALGPDASWWVEAAAWVHDIGYAPDLVVTRLHALDGARWLRDHPAGREVGGPIVWHLVAHHTGAMIEAQQRGLSEALLGEFPTAGPSVAERRSTTERHSADATSGWTFPELVDVLTWCDLTTTPTGKVTTPTARLAEILSRYSSDDPVHQAVTRSRPILLAQCERVESWITDTRAR